MSWSVCSDVESPDAEFYDLVSNPERYTGYAGQSAVNIWKLIYDQNCFKYNTSLPMLSRFCHALLLETWEISVNRVSP